MEASTVVIKVKYCDTLRRFNALVVDEKLNINMSELTVKIFSLFNIDPNSKIMLAYTDEDGDLVALVDDNDLHDVVKQGLNPFRITVKLNTEKNGPPSTHSEGSSPPRSPRVQLPFQNSNSIASEFLKTIPEPLRETLVNLSSDLVSKVSSPASDITPSVNELINYLSKVGLSYLNQLSETRVNLSPNTESGLPESIISAPETKNPVLSKVNLPTSKVTSNVGSGKRLSKNYPINAKLKKPEAVTKHIEVKFGGTTEASSSKETASPSIGVKEKANMVNESDLSVKSPPAVSSLPPGARDAFNPVEVHIADGRPKCVYPNVPYNTADPFSIPSPVNFGPSQPTSEVVSINRSKSQNDDSMTIIHHGVRCDGCEVYPIAGPRFKSKVKLDYDLCNLCFWEMGNANDYIRMDHPAIYPHQWSFKGLNDYHGRRRCPAFQQVQRGSKSKPGSFKLDSRFIQDVNVLDGTVIAPLTPFTKIWRMRNNGTVVWPQNTQIVWIGGDKLSNTLSVEVEVPAAGLAVDTELDVAVDFIAPELPGRYISYWRMASASGHKFGQRVWVLIHVDATFKETTQYTGVQGINLNLPLVDSVLTDPEIINVDLAPLTEDSNLEPDNSKRMVDIVDPETQQQPNIEQEMKFPITDSLLVGSSTVPLPRPFYHPYPIVDLPAMPSPALSSPPSALFAPPLPARYPPPLSSALFALPAASLPALNSPPPPSALYAPTAASLPARPMIIPPPPPFTVNPSPALYELNPQPPPTVDPQAYVKNVPGKEDVEKKLLRELEEMGFTQVDLNKEILRMNEYDLEQAVDDLCEVSEWDPILEELREMGFHDTEMNKALLKKNNGSIKRVVMDLISEERNQ